MTATLMARKLGMTQIFNEDGTVVPVTAFEAGPCMVVSLKTKASDGYDAVVLGYRSVRPGRLSKPREGVFRKAGVGPMAHLFEVRVDDPAAFQVGQELRCDVFQAGDRVDVSGVSKGKGFQGQVRRHGFSRGPESHGSMNVRQAGSIGATDAARVFKGTRMAGHMGSSQATVRNIRVVSSDSERNLLLVRGGVPGARNGEVLIRPTNIRIRRQ